MLRLYNPRPSAARTMSKWTMGILATYSLALLTLVGVATSYPDMARWMSDATEAAGVALRPSVEQETAEMAQPAGPVLAARTDSLATAAARPADRPYR